jgi:hypothetical protein
MLSTDQKGNIAEAAIALAATRLDIDVYRPVGEGGRYDMILDLGRDLLRVQCKWAARAGDVILVRCYSSRRSAGGKLVTRRYSTDEVDAFGAYSRDLDRCFLLPPELWANRRLVQLRIAPTRNNQARRINWADDYDFEARLRALGAVAQLGERLAGSQKATGSSPVGSTFGSSFRQERLVFRDPPWPQASGS